jgi:hypothetical protein
MRDLVAAVAGPRTWTDNRKSWLSRAARRAGISYRSVKAVWYGEITDESHHAIRLLQHEAGRRAQVLAGKFESIARGLQVTDSEFYRDEILNLIDVARSLRGVALPGDDKD